MDVGGIGSILGVFGSISYNISKKSFGWINYFIGFLSHFYFLFKKNNWIHIIRPDLSLHVALHKISEPADKNTSCNLEPRFALSWKYKIMHKIRLFLTMVPLPTSLSHSHLLQAVPSFVHLKEDCYDREEPALSDSTRALPIKASWVSNSFLPRPHSLLWKIEGIVVNYLRYPLLFLCFQ